MRFSLQPRALNLMAVALSAVCAVFAGASTAHAQSSGAVTQGDVAEPTRVIARVNGTDITAQDLILAEQEIGGQLQRMPAAQRRRVLVEFLVENQLVASAAQKSDLAKSDEYKARMTYWSRRSLRDSYFDANIEASIDDAAITSFYEKEVAQRASGEEVRASHILVKTEEKANELFEALAHDGDFAELAQKNSIDPGSKTNGGDLGFFGKGRMVPAFEKAAFGLKEGEVSEPVKSQFGWHIIKVTEKRKQAPPPLAQIRDRIKLLLVRRKATEVVDAFRKDAKIDYVDPAVKALVDQSNAAAKKPSPGDTPAPNQ